ncbi:hypothetical protein J6590_102247 [Homalodisca vitripennis]|nr:hypothetical protein J6590_102247 [Homalodisca vitripennis]
MCDEQEETAEHLLFDCPANTKGGYMVCFWGVQTPLRLKCMAIGCYIEKERLIKNFESRQVVKTLLWKEIEESGTCVGRLLCKRCCAMGRKADWMAEFISELLVQATIIQGVLKKGAHKSGRDSSHQNKKKRSN